MAIKCGRCQCYHETVADVKTCSQGGRVAVLDPPATATKQAGKVNTGVPRHAQQADWPTIKAGYYAIPSLTGNQDLDFFRVDAPDDGNWKGFLFVKRVLGGGADSLRTERVHRSTADQVLTVLIPPFAAQAARERFGQEIGRCGCCGRSLTDETSRARGIGPDCASKS